MGSFGRFVRLWLLLAFSYALVRFLFNLGVRGFVDVSARVLDELVYVPLLEAAIFWQLVRWRARRAPNP
jgi:hypothetical protein